MIVVKARCESEELLMFRSLNLRMNLSSSDAHYYSYLEKGYMGELEFDRIAESCLSDDWIAVNDLLLKYHNKIFQIDSLFVRHGLTFLNDVKNFDGDYIIKDRQWFTAFGNEIDDPLEQLDRCESRLRQLCHSLGFSFRIESRLVFVNPEFYLFQAPLNLPIIFPAHLNRYMNQLNKTTGRLTERDFKLAKKLASLHIKKSPFTNVPPYTYEKLKKGLACGCGRGFMCVNAPDMLECLVCGRLEDVESAILRGVSEFKLLFPEKRISTNGINEWFGGDVSSRTIRRVLMKNLKYQGHGKSAHFVE